MSRGTVILLLLTMAALGLAGALALPGDQTWLIFIAGVPLLGAAFLSTTTPEANRD